jgi:hypothetical protein
MRRSAAKKHKQENRAGHKVNRAGAEAEQSRRKAYVDQDRNRSR